MPKLMILSSRELKELGKMLDAYYGISIKLSSLDYAFLENSKGRIYAITKDISRINLEDLHIDTMGIYVINRKGRLSIEGSQIFGKYATKNIVDIDNAKEWLKGHDVKVIGPTDFSGHVLVRCGDDFLGCGRYKDGVVTNLVAKNRWINEDA